jgi:hypothetical protein
LSRAEAAAILTKAFLVESSSADAPAALEPESTKPAPGNAQAPAPSLQSEKLKKPYYAIVDTLHDKVGVSSTTRDLPSFDPSHPGVTVSKHKITELKTDRSGMIYYIESDLENNVRGLNKMGEESVIGFLFGTAYKQQLQRPEGEPPYSQQNNFQPVKLLIDPDSAEMKLAGTWPAQEYWSVHTLVNNSGGLLGIAEKGSKLVPEDFIVQLTDGAMIYSDISSGTLNRMKSGGSKSEWSIKMPYSGKALAAVAQGQTLYLFDSGKKSIMKVNLDTKQLIDSISVQTDDIKSVLAKGSRFYVSTGNSIISLDIDGKSEAFIDTNEFVYNENDILNPEPFLRKLRHNMPVITDEISLFTFEPDGNIVYFDESLRVIRRLRLVTDGNDDPTSPVPPAPKWGTRLPSPEASTLAREVGLQSGNPGNRVVSIVPDTDGYLYITDHKIPVIAWNLNTMTGEARYDETDRRKEGYMSSEFVYRESGQGPAKPIGIRYTNMVYHDISNNKMYLTGWNPEQQIATINQIQPDTYTAGYMEGRAAIDNNDFILSNGAGLLAVSDIKQNGLWIIGADRKGRLVTPFEVGGNIKYSGSALSAIWSERNLFVLDAGRNTITKLELDPSYRYRPSEIKVKIEEPIDAVYAYGDTFFALEGTTLYQVDMNGSVKMKDDLSMHLKKGVPALKISVDSTGSLFVLDREGTLKRIRFYKK